jgi:hypothetical protein
MSAAPKVAALRGGGVSLAAAADAFLATQRTANPNTHRAHASAIDRLGPRPPCWRRDVIRHTEHAPCLTSA